MDKKEHVAKKEKILEQLTNQQKTERQLKNQFYYMANNHKDNPFMEESDLEHFRSATRGVQIHNTLMFSASLLLAGGIYKVLGGFVPSEKRPWLRRLRHFSAVGIPSLLLPTLISFSYPGKSENDILQLSIKYRSKLLDPEFNKKFIQLQTEKFNQKHQRQ